jgi:hypothetical protein
MTALSRCLTVPASLQIAAGYRDWKGNTEKQSTPHGEQQTTRLTRIHKACGGEATSEGVRSRALRPAVRVTSSRRILLQLALRDSQNRGAMIRLTAQRQRSQRADTTTALAEERQASARGKERCAFGCLRHCCSQ